MFTVDNSSHRITLIRFIDFSEFATVETFAGHGIRIVISLYYSSSDYDSRMTFQEEKKLSFDNSKNVCHESTRPQQGYAALCTARVLRTQRPWSSRSINKSRFLSWISGQIAQKCGQNMVLFWSSLRHCFAQATGAIRPFSYN